MGSDDRVSPETIVETQGDAIREWFRLGMGRRLCAMHYREQTGHYCSHHTMAKVFERLGLRRPPPEGFRRLDIEDTTIDDAEDPGDRALSIEELIESRVAAARRKKRKDLRHSRRLTLPAEPVGFFVMGDPHLDNEGCDWDVLNEHLHIVENVEGLLGVNVGDITDNWIGRLGHLYSKSSVTASDGWRLSEYLLDLIQWVAIVGGNHDSWASAAGIDPWDYLSKKHGVQCYAPDELRLTLSWKDYPELEPVVWVLRHDFRGRSWFNDAHGPNKEAMLDGHAHILTAGHIHSWAQLSTEQRHARVTHAIRVRGYKRGDDYARRHGYHEQQHGESCIITIDPFDVTAGRIKVHWSLETGVQYLQFLREMRNEGRAVDQ